MSSGRELRALVGVPVDHQPRDADPIERRLRDRVQLRIGIGDNTPHTVADIPRSLPDGISPGNAVAAVLRQVADAVEHDDSPLSRAWPGQECGE